MGRGRRVRVKYIPHEGAQDPNRAVTAPASDIVTWRTSGVPNPEGERAGGERGGRETIQGVDRPIGKSPGW